VFLIAARPPSYRVDPPGSASEELGRLASEHDDDLLEAGEVDRRRAGDRLVDAEVAPHDLRDGAHRDALREAQTDAARDEAIADLDLVGALHVLDVAGVLAFVARATHVATRSGALDEHVDARTRVDDQAHVDRVSGHLECGADDTVRRQHGRFAAIDGEDLSSTTRST
jgi:hypothetical protein